jgi:hypothetical protein
MMDLWISSLIVFLTCVAFGDLSIESIVVACFHFVASSISRIVLILDYVNFVTKNLFA